MENIIDISGAVKAVMASKRIPQSILVAHLKRDGATVSKQLAGRREWYKGDDDLLLQFLAMFQPIVITK
jgi:hypothetical protein